MKGLHGPNRRRSAGRPSLSASHPVSFARAPQLWSGRFGKASYIRGPSARRARCGNPCYRSRGPSFCAFSAPAALHQAVCCTQSGSQSKGLVDGMQYPSVTLLGSESDQMVEDAAAPLIRRRHSTKIQKLSEYKSVVFQHSRKQVQQHPAKMVPTNCGRTLSCTELCFT